MDIQTSPLTEVFDWRQAPPAEFAVIAEDPSHSLSPVMHNAAFRAANLLHRYVAVRVSEGEVSAALDHLLHCGYTGVNVTMPHKEEASRWVDEFHATSFPEVRLANVLALKSKLGFNTDAVGFWQTLKPLGLDQETGTLLLIGAGGAATAVAVVMCRFLEWRCLIWNRTPHRAEELAEFIGSRASVVEEPDPSGCDLIVNATSVAKSGGTLPIDWEKASPNALAYDLFYAKEPTAFLSDASQFGLRTVDGVSMLVNQGAESWPCWGIREDPSRAIMEGAARELLAADSTKHRVSS